MSNEEEEDVNFKPGHEITTFKMTYTVTRLLGEGGFGAVYLVKSKNKQYAMKVERKLDNRRHSKLKMEIAILKLLTGKHFTKIVDRGKNDEEKYFFLVMELVGKSLADLKMERAERCLSFPCGMGTGLQCLEAVQEMHKAGYLHRDIKPQNFACGIDDKKHCIYILDFGISRKFKNAKNEIKTPREHVGFKGTVRFAPLNCHRGTELGPKDDCESWLYMVLELCLSAGLPWRRITEKSEVLKSKEETRKDRRLFGDIKRPDELIKILDYIDSRQYQDRVDYDYIYKMLRETCTCVGADLDAPFDWEVATPSALSPATAKE